ncbi:MAG: helix-turn-helix domain-containing protein [Muribaculaceae bacterium]
MTSLYLLQFGCLIVAAILAILLVLSRLQAKWINPKYEVSRATLFIAMLIMATHYVLQMAFGLRAQGVDVGAAVNILFYSPATFLVSYSLLNLSTSKKSRKRFMVIGIVGYLLIVAVFAHGWFTHRSLHIGSSLQVMHVLYIVFLLTFIILPIKEIHFKHKSIENQTGADIKPYLTYTYSGHVLLGVFTAFSTVAIVNNAMLFILAPLVFLSLTVFVSSFISLGFNIIPTIIGSDDSNVVDEGIEGEHQFATTDNQAAPMPLPDSTISDIEVALKQWSDQGGFRDSAITITLLSKQIKIDRRDLSIYFNQYLQCTFRSWLSGIRLKEAQRIMMAHPDFSNDVISSECGLTSRGQLYNIFHDKTGMSPKEWKERQLKQ